MNNPSKKEKPSEASVKTQTTEVTQVKEEKAVEAKKEQKKPIRRAVIEPRGRLHIDADKKDPEMVYRFVNDQAGKVQDAKDLGYEFVNNDMTIGDGTVDEASGLGSAKVIEAGKYRGSVKSYLMACPKEIYDERQKAKREANEAVLKNTIKANKRSDQEDPTGL